MQGGELLSSPQTRRSGLAPVLALPFTCAASLPHNLLFVTPVFRNFPIQPDEEYALERLNLSGKHGHPYPEHWSESLTIWSSNSVHLF
jgi:hypothetical protein